MNLFVHYVEGDFVKEQVVLVVFWAAVITLNAAILEESSNEIVRNYKS